MAREMTVRLDDADFKRIERYVANGVAGALNSTRRDGREVVATTVAAAKAVMAERGVTGEDADAIARAIASNLALQLAIPQSQ